MCGQKQYTPVDYLVVGHLTKDETPSGPIPGGTVSYAALTAAAMGLRVGVLTAYPEEPLPPEMAGVQIAVQPTARATTFENLTTPQGRIQFIHHMADVIQPEWIPAAWLQTPIVHFGPIAHEVSVNMLDAFPSAQIGITPQGWMRQWDEQGRITFGDWPQASSILPRASAVIISDEDVAGNEATIANFRKLCELLVVTQGDHGARIYQGSRVLNFAPPAIKEVDATGAGDIFSAIFFCHYFQTGNIASAARLANLVAAHSIARPGLKGPPQPAEVQAYLAEINEEK